MKRKLNAGAQVRASYFEEKYQKTLATIANERPTLIEQATAIGEAKRALEAAETGINLQHLIAELHARGMTPGEISRLIGYSSRQIRRYVEEWKRRTA